MLPDGSLQIFSLANTLSPRQVFLTQMIDPVGNTLTFTYDGSYRLVSATDALGQVTTLFYGLTNDVLKITQVTDPFGRYATFQYDQSGQLTNITDILGITSAFTYTNNARNNYLAHYAIRYYDFYNRRRLPGRPQCLVAGHRSTRPD